MSRSSLTCQLTPNLGLEPLKDFLYPVCGDADQQAIPLRELGILLGPAIAERDADAIDDLVEDDLEERGPGTRVADLVAEVAEQRERLALLLEVVEARPRP